MEGCILKSIQESMCLKEYKVKRNKCMTDLRYMGTNAGFKEKAVRPIYWSF